MNIFKILAALALTLALGACDTGNDDAKYLGYWKDKSASSILFIITKETNEDYGIRRADLTQPKHDFGKGVGVFKNGKLYAINQIGETPVIIQKDGSLLLEGDEYTRLTDPEIVEAKKALELK